MENRYLFRGKRIDNGEWINAPVRPVGHIMKSGRNAGTLYLVT